MVGCVLASGTAQAQTRGPEVAPGALPSLAALAAQGYLAVSFTGTGAGTVTLSASGFPDAVCAKDCTQKYRRGTRVSVQFTPARGSYLTAMKGNVDKCVAGTCSVTVRQSTSVAVVLGSWDAEWAARRLDLIRYLWNQETLPSWPPSLVEDLGRTMPAPMAPGLIPSNYSLDGAFESPNLDHYERWAMRPAPDVHGLGYFGSAGSWGWAPFARVPGADPHVSEPQAYVPVLYFAPVNPTTKLFIIHDGHSPYGQAGHRALARWALDHGFAVAVIVMPYFLHDLVFVRPWSLWPSDQGDIMRIFFEATTNTVSHAQSLGYTTFVLEGISGGGWTTHFVAALDPRISVSYAVAGSLPHALRDPQNPSEIGDSEQLADREVYGIASFEDLYAMAASNGRRANQILLEYDTCCFAAHGREAQIEAYAATANARVSGTFRTLIDRGYRGHDVSAWTIQAIEDDLRGLGIVK